MFLTDTFLKHTPLPIAILDRSLKFLHTSDLWNKHFKAFGLEAGNSFEDCKPDLPEALFLDMKRCLEGVEKRSDTLGHKDKDGNVVWYKWDVNSWKGDSNIPGGLILILENRTETERKQDLIHKSLEVARIGHWEADLEKNSLFWSRITKEIHQVPKDYEPDVASAINFYKAGKSRNTITDLVNRGITEGTPWDTELQIVTTSGKEVWVRAKGEAEFVNGKCIRLFGTFQDIDLRKRAEFLSKDASDRLVQATNAAGIGIWEYHFREKKVVWDHNMHAIYGIPQIKGSDLLEAWNNKVAPEDRKRSIEKLQASIIANTDFSTQFPVVWPDGQVHWLRSQAEIIKDKNGKALKMIGACWDFTELKNTQLKLLKIEESLQGAFSNSKVGMALVSKEGQFMEVNDSLCLSLGYDREALCKLTFQQITHPEDLDEDLALLQEVIDLKRQTYQIEKRFFHKQGNIVHIFLTVTAVTDFKGNISHFISQFVDITTRIETEIKLKSVLGLTSKQNESLLNFAHIVSHNLRSHATNISMITGFLLADKISAGEQKNALNMLQSAADGLNETIKHLNEVVQVQITSTKDLKTLELYPIIEKVLGDIDALIQKSKAQINVNLDKEIKILGIPAYTESVILNLLTNALKYRYETRPSKIDIKATEKNNRIQVSVSDNGIGIDLEKYGNKLFGMYKTFHGNKDAKGIGLFITKNQIEAMGGSIQAESSQDQGSRFIIEFLKP